MNYRSIKFQKQFCVEELFSLHYFEYMSSFSFPGESHDFWEFVCVDKGEVWIGAGEETLCLKRGEIRFHQPEEFHWVKANGSDGPNLVVVSFACHSPAMDFFRGKTLGIDDFSRGLLAKIIQEGRRCLLGRLDDPYQTVLEPDPQAPAGSAQLIQNFLEQLLIYLYRKYQKPPFSHSRNPLPKPDKTVKENLDTEIFQRIGEYLNSNLSSHFTIEKICRDNLIGRSQLQKIIHKKTGLGVIEYVSFLKISAAKEMIREEQMNFTQIAEKLGYSSVHYFSRQFKKLTQMTPSEYASSIKAMAERGF